jgi:ribosomal protein S18 acetylase RimI-like enzyme
VDYSFIVRGIALPPFDGSDIVNIRDVAPFRKTYRLPADNYRSHVQSPNSALFIALKEHRTVGFLAISIIWNGYVQIDDLAVDVQSRGRGIGTHLLAKAISFASCLGSVAIKAETQSLNLPACRFYRKSGFELGGFDRFHYGHLAGETALFWYFSNPHIEPPNPEAFPGY